MTVVRAASVDEAVAAVSELPGAVLLSGGTEVVVALAEGTLHAEHLVTLRRIPGLRGLLEGAPHEVVLGGLTTYADLAGGIGGVPVLTAMAATVGSPASRNAGTLGGGIGTASGYGDAVTALVALDAEVVVAAADGTRRVALAHWLDGTARRAGDVVIAAAVRRTRGGQAYLKPGERQAVTYATVSCALVVDAEGGRVSCALGSVGPTPVRVQRAEDWLAERLTWQHDQPVVDVPTRQAFADRVREELAEPRPGLRVTSEHRRHVAGVLAARALSRVAA